MAPVPHFPYKPFLMLPVQAPTLPGTGSNAGSFANLYAVWVTLLCWLKSPEGDLPEYTRAGLLFTPACNSWLPEHTTLSPKKSTVRLSYQSRKTGDVINMNNNTPKNGILTALHRARAMISNDEHASPQQLPAGGWVREASCRENWRTTTIVHRHRDRAATPPL